MRSAVVALIAAGLVALIGCGSGNSALSATPSVAASTASTAAQPSMVGGTGTASPTPSHTAAPAQPVSVRGVVHAGARPGCDTLLADDGTHYLLLEVTDPPRGVPVEVTGFPDAALVSYCNSGLPLHVQRISRR